MTPADTNPLREAAIAEAYKLFPDETEPSEHPLGKIVVDRGSIRYGFLAGFNFATASEPVAGTVEQRGTYEDRHPNDMVLHPLTEIREWDEALAVLGIQDSDQTPADAIRERDAEIERLRALYAAPAPSGRWTLHRQPADQITDHGFSIWLDDEPVILTNLMPGQSVEHLNTMVALLNGPAVSPQGRGAVDWVTCPICDEPDMRKETFDEGAALIHCTNHGCASNGALKGRGLKFEYDADREVRLSSGLIAIHQAPANVTADAMRSVAYDIAFNCIPVDVAEFQLERRSTPPAPRAADRAVAFCEWLQGYFKGDVAAAGKDELTAHEANTIRGTLSEMVFPPVVPANTGETSEVFRCNCPHEVRSGCSEPKCPHYAVPRADRGGGS